MKLTSVLLEWALTSSFLILAVAALRALLGRRVSARLRYALWAAVLVRLLVPVQLFTTPVTGSSIMRETGVEQFLAQPPAPAASIPAYYDHLPPSSYLPVIYQPNITELPDGTFDTVGEPTVPELAIRAESPLILQVLGWVWLTGSLVIGLALVLSNFGFARRLHRVRTPSEGPGCPLPVYTAPNLPSPCLFGLARPGVYITPETAADPAMLRHILAHEYTHFRHGDHVWNVLRSIVLALHWWNPLVWLAVVLSRRDCELACDEGALKRLGDGERTAYGRTLLTLLSAAQNPRPHGLLTCATTMTGGQKSVRERVTRIAHAPRRWLWAAVTLVLVAALACVCAFGSASEPDTADGTEPSGTPGSNAGKADDQASGATLDDLTTDLTFSSQFGTSGRPYVRMEGSVGDVVLTRGATWSPENVWKDDASQELSMVYPAFEGLGGHVLAWWTDEAHTAVTVSTMMSAILSSQFNVGYWEFTVDLDSGAVTAMDGLSFRDGFPDEETYFYPQSISDGEAVKAARVSAKLLTAGEDYYNNLPTPPDFTPIELEPVYTLDELGVSVRVTGIDCTAAWWYPARENSYSGELMEAHLSLSDARCLGESFNSTYGGVTVRYDPVEASGLIWMHMYPRGSGLTYVNCSVNLLTGEVTEQAAYTDSDWKMVSPVLSEGEMLAAARALAALYRGAADYYTAATILPIEEGPLPFDTAMRLWFGSGAGGWRTILTLHPDGSFVGDYSDSDMGVSGPGYDSTEYVCRFHGRFKDIRQVTNASWSMTLEELVLDTGHPMGEEWIEPIEDTGYNRRYISSIPYGMDGGDGEALKPGAQFIFYTPEASRKQGGELYGMEDESSELYQFWAWCPKRRTIDEGRGDTLDCYALRSVGTGCGFFDLHAWGLI